MGVQGRIGVPFGQRTQLLTEGLLEVVYEIILGTEEYDAALRDCLIFVNAAHTAMPGSNRDGPFQTSFGERLLLSTEQGIIV